MKSRAEWSETQSEKRLEALEIDIEYNMRINLVDKIINEEVRIPVSS